MNKFLFFTFIYFVCILDLFANENQNIDENSSVDKLITNIKENNNKQNEEIDVEEKIIEKKALKIKDVPEINNANVVVLQALNKITAKSYKYEIKIGDKINFERLVIEPLFCWKSSPADISENKVLLKIIENKIDKSQKEIFYGWMFSSSPSISSMEHPMYDIKIVDCKKVKIDDKIERPSK